jgi:hypothetical protein
MVVGGPSMRWVTCSTDRPNISRGRPHGRLSGRGNGLGTVAPQRGRLVWSGKCAWHGSVRLAWRRERVVGMAVCVWHGGSWRERVVGKVTETRRNLVRACNEFHHLRRTNSGSCMQWVPPSP